MSIERKYQELGLFANNETDNIALGNETSNENELPASKKLKGLRIYRGQVISNKKDVRVYRGQVIA